MRSIGDRVLQAPLWILLLGAIIALFAPGCADDPLEPGASQYVIFGDYYGECVGEGCIDLYLIENGQVFEDTLDRYPSVSNLPPETKFVAISNEAYDDLVAIFSDIPSRLFEESEVIIGEPDAGDWGGFYLQTLRDGKTRYWLIDKMEDNLPRYLRSFVPRLEEAILLAEGSGP